MGPSRTPRVSSSESRTWRCDQCGREETVWRDKEHWFGCDSKRRAVYLVQPRTPPLPPNWLDFGDVMFCERHTVRRYAYEELGGEVGISRRWIDDP